MLSAGCAADKIRHGGWGAKADQEEAMVTCGLPVEAAAAAVYGLWWVDLLQEQIAHCKTHTVYRFLFKLDFKLLHML